MDAQLDIPQGQTKEEIQLREKIIKNFYANWIAIHPTKHIFNIALNDFIHVRFLSIQETAEHAAFTYKSTLAVTYLTEIMEKATVEKRVKPKPNNQNQKRFSEIIIMQYNKRTFGKIKLTVGVLKGSRQNIQYCITAMVSDASAKLSNISTKLNDRQRSRTIEKTTNNPPRPGNSY
jgi:hypothetical protein